MLPFSSFLGPPADDNGIALEFQGVDTGAIMRLKSVMLSLAVFVASALAGCVNTDPFWRLDHCYLADWTNQQSCLSCCPDGNCQHR
jgi:hypothetical protein